MEKKTFEDSFGVVERMTIPKIWNDMEAGLSKVPEPFKFILKIIGVWWFSAAKLIYKFYKNTILSFVLFSFNFLFFYLPIYPQATSVLDRFLGENAGFALFFLSGFGLLMTIPMFSKKFKEEILNSAVTNPKSKSLTNLYAGTWIISIATLLTLDFITALFNLLLIIFPGG